MLSKVYKAEKHGIYHFDFYRLSEAGLMEHELHDALDDPNGVVVVEWGEVVQHVLPQERLTIRIDKTADDSREITCSYPANLGYLMEKA